MLISQTISEKAEGGNLFESFAQSLHKQSDLSQPEPQSSQAAKQQQQQQKPQHSTKRMPGNPMSGGYTIRHRRKKEKKRMSTRELLEANQKMIAFEDKLRRTVLSRETKRVVVSEEPDADGQTTPTAVVPNYIKLRVSNRHIRAGAQEMENQELLLDRIAKARSDMFVAMRDTSRQYLEDREKKSKSRMSKG